MRTKTAKKNQEIIYRNGKPAAVIVGMAEYREMLERIEDSEDLKTLKKIRNKALKFRTLEDILSDHKRRA